MSHYLDSDSQRRQSNTVVRLTVITILGLIATVTTGYFGMNIIPFGEGTLLERVLHGLFASLVFVSLVMFAVSRSKRLSDFLEAMSDELKREIAFIIKWNPRKTPVEAIASKKSADASTPWVTLRPASASASAKRVWICPTWAVPATRPGVSIVLPSAPSISMVSFCSCPTMRLRAGAVLNDVQSAINALGGSCDRLPVVQRRAVALSPVVGITQHGLWPCPLSENLGAPGAVSFFKALNGRRIRNACAHRWLDHQTRLWYSERFD